MPDADELRWAEDARRTEKKLFNDVAQFICPYFASYHKNSQWMGRTKNHSEKENGKKVYSLKVKMVSLNVGNNNNKVFILCSCTYTQPFTQ